MAAMIRCTFKGTAEQLASALQEHCKELEWVPKFNKPTPRLVKKHFGEVQALLKIQPNGAFQKKRSSLPP
jgi:hypothetical protein